MSKKGFTLIEIIAAIAIFSIAIVSISVGLMTATRTWKKSDVKLQTMYYAQGMVEVLTGSDINKLKSMGTDLVNGSSCFVYFNQDYNNFSLYFLKNGVASVSNTFSDTANPNNFIGWYNSGPAINSLVSSEDYNAGSTDANLYNKCIANNTTKKKYGGYVMLKNSGDNLYLKVRIWDLQFGQDSGSTREIYMR
ncbi:prepilin-type N-terminal cleavage/methylation domain-containing protein [Clostridium sp. YIM B02515]|uniref:Prepilin-type N-terminal cleavage/methylation domain-containing protein n=1 Tax=Clostridium rhizosphaerae TaxID=2803861 RepID=A0ABS1TCX6_9CLOT|nr:prepilin-type N-terminal cleavage/methylation domain-containing protein [Clostridium rhizosphaerae]MBL4937200.1 prepilin-type N-terminal cleavage/methylation domain-containing protein [Clostridium rhizosphaerae]